MMKLFVLLLLLMQLVDGAVVVGVSNVRISGIGDGQYDIQIAEEEDPVGGYTCFLFSHVSGATFQYGGSCLDDGVSVFFVEGGDQFTESSILGGEFVELDSVMLAPFPTGFHLGFRTPNLNWGGSLYPPAYGWAEFRQDGAGNLSLMDHAVAYGTQGIVVGTTVPIPEPKGVFSILGLIIFLRRRRLTLSRGNSNDGNAG